MLLKLNLLCLKIAPLVKVRVSGKHYRDALPIWIQEALETLPKNPLPLFKPSMNQMLALIFEIETPFF